MNFYQHRFENLEDYLHHRDPYLMVNEVVQIEENAITTIKKFDGTEHFATGHFPGTMIFPGAMMQEITTQSAGILIAANFNPMAEYNTHDPFFNEWALGVLVKVSSARYKGFARPGDVLQATVKLNEQVGGTIFDFDGRVTINEKTIMQNQFQLMNIKSETLQGQ